MKKGTFCISIDHELLWGRKDLDYSHLIPDVKKEREVIKKLLLLFTKYNVPATWAVVGELKNNGDMLWHSPDTISAIESTKLQEIGSHSYSHQVFTDINSQEAEYEIKSFRKRSFVFPRNQVAHLNILRKYGFRKYRGREDFIPRNKLFAKIIQLLDFALLIPRTSKLKKTNGLTNVPGTMYFLSARGIRKFIPRGMRFIKAKMCINRAINNGQIFHLWFHPIDLVRQQEKLFCDLEQILKYAREKSDSGQLSLRNMGDI